MTPNASEIQKIIDKILNNGRPRSLFLWDGKIYDCPSDGALERKYLGRTEYLFLGRYDCEATQKMLIDDITVAEAESAAHH